MASAGERPSQIRTCFRAGNGRCLKCYPLHGPRGSIYMDGDHRSSLAPSKSLPRNPALGGVTGSWAISMASHRAAKANAKGKVEASPPGGRRSHEDLTGARSEDRGGLLGFHEEDLPAPGSPGCLDSLNLEHGWGMSTGQPRPAWEKPASREEGPTLPPPPPQIPSWDSPG